MAYEQKDMTFSLFPNKDRKTDKHANMTGSALINGVSYFVDAWVNFDSNNNKYISGKLKVKDKQQAAPPQQLRAYHPDQATTLMPPDNRRQLDDEIPFSPEFR